MIPTNASEVPGDIIADLYEWIKSGDIDYLRDLTVKDKLIQAHTLGGGMAIRNFLRRYPERVSMDCHWLDDNWIPIICRMFKDKEGWIMPINYKGGSLT